MTCRELAEILMRTPDKIALLDTGPGYYSAPAPTERIVDLNVPVWRQFQQPDSIQNPVEAVIL
jgi:hypothetical protein